MTNFTKTAFEKKALIAEGIRGGTNLLKYLVEKIRFGRGLEGVDEILKGVKAGPSTVEGSNLLAEGAKNIVLPTAVGSGLGYYGYKAYQDAKKPWYEKVFNNLENQPLKLQDLNLQNLNSNLQNMPSGFAGQGQ